MIIRRHEKSSDAIGDDAAHVAAIACHHRLVRGGFDHRDGCPSLLELCTDDVDARSTSLTFLTDQNVTNGVTPSRSASARAPAEGAVAGDHRGDRQSLRSQSGPLPGSRPQRFTDARRPMAPITMSAAAARANGVRRRLVVETGSPRFAAVSVRPIAALGTRGSGQIMVVMSLTLESSTTGLPGHIGGSPILSVTATGTPCPCPAGPAVASNLPVRDVQHRRPTSRQTSYRRGAALSAAARAMVGGRADRSP